MPIVAVSGNSPAIWSARWIPKGAQKLEGARAELEEARGMKDYAHLRRNGARDPVELHMNRVYGRRLQGGGVRTP